MRRCSMTPWPGSPCWHGVIWVNPLRASPGYAPLARGMATALPHVDEFVDGHSFGSLENLAELLGQRRFGVY